MKSRTWVGVRFRLTLPRIRGELHFSSFSSSFLFFDLGFLVANSLHHEIGAIYSPNLVERMVRLEIEMEGIKGGG